MTKDVANIIWWLLKLNVQKTLMNTIATNAKWNRNVYNFLDDYREAKAYVDKATWATQDQQWTTSATSIPSQWSWGNISDLRN